MSDSPYNCESGVGVNAWIDANEASFCPPVCNKLMFGTGLQTKVMYVGGPNVRKDYHMNEGEEMFLQLRGNMLLKVMEHGQPKDIHIREGEIFMLPGGVPHSPNRPEKGSVGLVIERERLETETDGVRWYVDDSNEAVLYERWFHCTDLGTQLGPVIKGYFASEEHTTRVPSKDIGEPEFALNVKSECMKPFHFGDWLKANSEKINEGPVPLFSEEFQVSVYGKGGDFKGAEGVETYMWVLTGSAKVVGKNGESATLGSDESQVFPAVASITDRSDDCRILVCQSTKRNPFTHPQPKAEA